jgi:hypothetical protein
MRVALSFLLAFALATPALAGEPPAVEEMSIEQMMAEAGELAAERTTIEKKLKDSLSVKASHESSLKLLENERIALDQEWASATADCKEEWPDDASYTSHMAWCTPTRARLDTKEKDLEQRGDALFKKEEKRVAEIQPAIARLQQTDARLRQLQAALRLHAFKGRNDSCLGESDLDRLHQCMQSVWDGGRTAGSLGKTPDPVVVPNKVTPRTAEDAISEYLNSGAKPGPKTLKVNPPPPPPTPAPN